MHYRFNVYGRIYQFERRGAEWRVWQAGNDGKRSPADFIVPDDVNGAVELQHYLEVLFHEHATPTNGEVRLIE